MDDVVLGERKSGRLVGIGTSDGEEGTEEFDADGNVCEDKGESDDCHNAVRKDEGRSVVNFVRIHRSSERDDNGKDVGRSSQKKGQGRGKAHSCQDDRNEIGEGVARCCCAEELNLATSSRGSYDQSVSPNLPVTEIQ